MATTPNNPVELFGANRFDLAVRAVRTALETIEALPAQATADEIFRATGRFSAAAGFLARELHAADQASRLQQGVHSPGLDEVHLVQGEVARAEASTRVEPANAELPSSEVS